jgi:hypothetical protein
MIIYTWGEPIVVFWPKRGVVAPRILTWRRKTKKSCFMTRDPTNKSVFPKKAYKEIPSAEDVAIEHGDFALPGQSEHSINRTLQIYQISTVMSANFGGGKWKRPRSYPKRPLFPRPLWHRVLGLVPTCAPSTRGQAPMAIPSGKHGSGNPQ